MLFVTTLQLVRKWNADIVDAVVTTISLQLPIEWNAGSPMLSVNGDNASTPLWVKCRHSRCCHIDNASTSSWVKCRQSRCCRSFDNAGMSRCCLRDNASPKRNDCVGGKSSNYDSHVCFHFCFVFLIFASLADEEQCKTNHAREFWLRMHKNGSKWKKSTAKYEFQNYGVLRNT